MLLAILYSLVDEGGILWLLASRKDEGWISGGILRLVLVNGSKVTRVTNYGLG